MTASPSPPPADQVEAAQVLYEAASPRAETTPWAILPAGQKAVYRRVAALRPVTSVAPEGMREKVARIIDPDRWWHWDEGNRGQCVLWDHTAESYCRNSFLKADAILAALPPASGSDQ